MVDHGEASNRSLHLTRLAARVLVGACHFSFFLLVLSRCRYVREWLQKWNWHEQACSFFQYSSLECLPKCWCGQTKDDDVLGTRLLARLSVCRCCKFNKYLFDFDFIELSEIPHP